MYNITLHVCLTTVAKQTYQYILLLLLVTYKYFVPLILSQLP